MRSIRTAAIGSRKSFWRFLALSGCVVMSGGAADLTFSPTLTIKIVTEVTPDIIVSPLGWASKPVLVDLQSKTVFVRSGCDFAPRWCVREPGSRGNLINPAT
jgi:hypothetical protein